MIISSPYRKAMQFIPNSPIPPSGMISRTLAIIGDSLARMTRDCLHLYDPRMTRLLTAFAFLFLFVTAASAATQTMRLDYYHTGDATSEVFSVDRVVIEPLPWPGDLKQAIDASNLGKYLFEVRDAKSKQLLYSRGFASIYGEW